jgi:hypothetical protein
MKSIFDSSVTEEYAYRPCLGIQRLYKTYGKTKFVTACDYAVSKDLKKYQFLKAILENNISQNNENEETIIEHDNIRGAEHYRKAGASHE